MLFNAAKNLPPMLSLFPDTILKHYDYLRDTMPNYVPHLQGEILIFLKIFSSTFNSLLNNQ